MRAFHLIQGIALAQLVTFTIANPIPVNKASTEAAGTSLESSVNSKPASLESTPGPYHFEAAPVWQEKRTEEVETKAVNSKPASLESSVNPALGSLESTPGPYHFEAAPVWNEKRANKPNASPKSDSLESTPGPYHFKAAPTWKEKRVHNPKVNPKTNSLESTPGPYHFKPAPTWERSNLAAESETADEHEFFEGESLQ